MNGRLHSKFVISTASALIMYFVISKVFQYSGNDSCNTRFLVWVRRGDLVFIFHQDLVNCIGTEQVLMVDCWLKIRDRFHLWI